MRRSLRFLSVLAALGALLSPARALVDVSPADGLPDIWELNYNTGALAPTADDDGDGQINSAEAIAGTNPKSSTSVLEIKSFSKSGNNVTVVFPALAGKRYEVQGSNNPARASFAPLSPPSIHNPTTDGPITATVAAGGSKFFCVFVTDVDADNDGLTNFEEKILSLNPNVADSNGDGTTDLAYVTAQLNLPDTVSIRAAESLASEDGPTPGTFEITRSRTLFPITVPYIVGGTAASGTDYVALPGTSVTFAQGESTKTISVNPTPDSAVESGESVTVTLSPPPPDLANAYSIAGSGAATVIIGETTLPSGSGLLAHYYDTASTTYADAVNFGAAGTYAFTRGTPTTTGTIVVTAPAAQFTGLQVGHLVKLTFTSGNAAIDNATFDHQTYPVTAVAAGSFSVSITSATAFTIASTTGNCNFSIQSFPHPAVITRVDPTVNFDWIYGTPNGVAISPNNSPDNYSATWDAYLQPTTAGNYVFQLDADDKARVLLDTGSGLVQILEHGWNGPATVGTFKQSATFALTVPASAAARYHIRVEHVETTGDARCRLQWSLNGGTFANIPQANQFTHTRAMTYSYTRSGTTPAFTGTIAVTPTGGHGFVGGETVKLAFSSGNLFTPEAATTYNGDYTVATVNGTTSYTVVVPQGATLPASGTGSGFVLNDTASTATGVFNLIHANTTFANSPSRIGVDQSVTVGNNGVWGSGTPDPVLIKPDTFSIRWTGQVQPQFTEQYTFVVNADDGCVLRINGQPQVLRTMPAASTTGSTYVYDAATGNAVVNYAGLIVAPNSYAVGEPVRLDPSSGALSHAPATSPTYRYDDVTGDVVVDYSTLTNVTPGGFAVGDTVELDPTSGSLSTLGLLPYVVTSATSNSFTVNAGPLTFTPTIAIASISTGNPCQVTTVANHGLVIGTQVQVKIASVSGGTFSPDINTFQTVTVTGPTTFTVASDCTVAPALRTGRVNIPGNITVSDNRTAVITAVTPTSFTVNIGANRYANASTGNISVDIINKPLKDWSSTANERYVHIPMVGGVRYDIQLDYFENTTAARCTLSWYSPSQPRQIVPSNRLYPTSSALAPPILVSPTAAVALVGGSFSYPIAGSNGANVTLSGNPAWLTYSGGVLSGTPPSGAAGHYQIVVTTTGPAGTGTSVIELDVQDTGGTIAREVWSGLAGTSVSSIPVNNPPTATSNLSSLEAPTDFDDNYGARIRGYITAPTTGNYYFWLSASNAAELWIANDDEPINVFKRASVSTGNTTPQTWSGEATQKSPWIALEAGQRYYIEILHKAGTGSGDNLAVGWLKPGEVGTAPSEVVPGYVLSPYVPPAAGSTPGTLYVATLLSQNGAVTTGVGTATLRMNEDETVGYLTVKYSGLSGTQDGPFGTQVVMPDGSKVADGVIDPTDWHVHSDPYLTNQSYIIYDGAEPLAGDGPQFDSANKFLYHKWNITNQGTLTADAVRELIKEGKAYINLHTALYPAGEIRGNFTLANGSRTFTPPPAPPAWTDDHTTNDGASRFLTQATFGPNPADIAALKAMASYDAWINDQFTKPASYQLPEVLRTENASAQGGAFDETLTFNAWWRNSISGSDQLRQRVAYALSQIHVVSGQGPLDNNAPAISHFYDHLADHAFDNFRDILKATTLTPGMGRYLDMLRNDKPDLIIGRSPNENYAREIKQLFAIGLFRMWPDGSLMLNSKDEVIPTYTQREIVGFSHVFTGWDYGYNGADRTSLGAATDWTRPMRVVPARHFTGPKRVLNNEVLPGLQTSGSQPLDPYATHNAAQFNDPEYKSLPNRELDAAHDQLFNHPNVGPFICRQLIQRMVMSNPSRDYLYRVVQKFNDNGLGVRGDMKAVIKAILLDYEARSNEPTTGATAKPIYGKQREPVLRVAAAGRAFRPSGFSGSYVQNSTSGRTITITTTTPHQLVSGNNVFLAFSSGSPAPWIGSYSATVTGASTLTVQAQGWASGTYSQTSGSSVMTISISGHWLPAGGQAYFDFTSGTANGLAGFDNTVRTAVTSTSTDTAAGTTFTITAPDTTGRSGNVMIPRFSPGSFTTASSGLAAPLDRRVTMDTNTDHHLQVGDQVQVVFFTGANPIPADRVVTVESVLDLNTWTFLAPSVENSVSTGLGTNQGNNNVYQFPLLSQPLNRTGSVASRPSTFAMGSTDPDMDQTPLNSPTVFNFFLPDYKFAGALAAQGITTPEFQSTAETNVIREANFIERGVYALGNTNGLSSFKNGSNALVMDLIPWMGSASSTAGPGLILGGGTATTQAWTSNTNLPVLIDRLNTLLLGGKLPAAAKTEIQKFVGRSIGSVALGNPCTVTLNNHGWKTGDSITISGVTGGTFSPTINGTFTITVPAGSVNTFTVPVNYSVAGANVTNAFAASGDIAYSNSSPTDTNKRDRLRAVLHFLLTSPDFIIQR